MRASGRRHNAPLITSAQSDSSRSLESLEGGEDVDKWRWWRLQTLANGLMIQWCRITSEEAAGGTDYIMLHSPAATISEVPPSKALNTQPAQLRPSGYTIIRH